MRKINQRVRRQVGATIMALLDGGGTVPAATYGWLMEESPAFWKGFPEQELIELCAEIQQSDVPEESRRLQGVFHEYNRRYFAGQLADYEVRVVYDLGYWADPSLHGGETGLHQPELRRILIRMCDSNPLMLSILVHEMAHAASDGNHGNKWLAEMRRLRTAGAPVGNIPLD